jgi:hypothetical protein
MRLFSIRHSRAGGNPVKLKFSMIRLYAKIGMKLLVIPACAGMTSLLVISTNAFAVSSISITAETIEYDKADAAEMIMHNTRADYDLKNDNIVKIQSQLITHDKGGSTNATLHNTRMQYDLNTKSTLNFQSDSIEHDEAKLDNADVVVDLAAKTTYTIKAQHISYQNLEARNSNIFLDFSKTKHAQTVLTFDTDIKQKVDKAWAKTQMNCLLPANLTAETWECNDAKFTAERMNLPFTLSVLPQPKGFVANVKLQNANFSDEAGLHAAEKLTGNLTVVAKQDGDTLRFSSALNWQSGEVFWQPLYFANGGHELQLAGNLRNNILTVDNANLKVDKVGDLNFNGKVDVKTYQLQSLDADLQNLNLTQAYPLLFKPFLGKTALNNTDLSGKAALKIHVVDSQVKTFTVQLNDVNIADVNKKFIFNNLNATIPWSYDEPKNIRIQYANGQLLNMPLGRTDISAEVNRYSLVSPKITLPILDGALNLEDVSAARINDNWYWHLGADLTAVSMPDVSKAFKLPTMEGKASAKIPLVTYSGGTLTTDGEIVLNVFKGTASVTSLTLQNPLGQSPVLTADMNLRNLDLGSLTRTFSFGAIEGKLDGDVVDLEMLKWKPIKMDASLHSSPGEYQRKISQRAVENITALGGAGAAAAIQRSFLRFFKEFNYEKMGLSCKLRNDACEMGGVQSTPGGYIIVKGNSIPAISVMGFTQRVGWADLIARVKRITDGNTKAIVK